MSMLVMSCIRLAAFVAMWSLSTLRAAEGLFLTSSFEGARCPGTEVTYTCIAPNTDTLQWTLTLTGGQFTSNTFTRVGNQVGSTQVLQRISSDDIVATLTNLSVGSMESTLTSILSSELDQAEVTCSAIDGTFGRTTSSVTVSVIDMPSTPQNLVTTTTQSSTDPVLVGIRWDQTFDFDTFPNLETYTITTEPSTFTQGTSIPSAIVRLSYGISYNVSVTAINCAGESAPAKIQVGPFVSAPHTQPDHSVHSGPGQDTPTAMITTTGPKQTTPNERDIPPGSESPPPLKEGTLIIAIVVSAGVVIVGCLAALFGAMVTVCIMKRSRKNSKLPKISQAKESVYSDVIHPVPNTAYMITSRPPTRDEDCNHDDTDEAGYEIITNQERLAEFSDSVMTASYAEASIAGSYRNHSSSYLQVIV